MKKVLLEVWPQGKINKKDYFQKKWVLTPTRQVMIHLFFNYYSCCCFFFSLLYAINNVNFLSLTQNSTHVHMYVFYYHI